MALLCCGAETSFVAKRHSMVAGSFNTSTSTEQGLANGSSRSADETHNDVRSAAADSTAKDKNLRFTRPHVPNSRARIRDRDAVRGGATFDGRRGFQPSGASLLASPFEGFGEIVVVVAGIGQHDMSSRRKVGDRWFFRLFDDAVNKNARCHSQTTSVFQLPGEDLNLD